MEKEVIAQLEQVTPAWLTAVLTQSGALTSGTVTAFETDSGAGNWSQNAQLILTYSDGAKGACPQNLFLKLVNTDIGDGEYFLPKEVTYYTRDYIDVPDAPLVRCYDAAYDATQHRYYLLLEDLSATHEAAYDLTPNLAHGEAVAERVGDSTRSLVGARSLIADWSRFSQCGASSASRHHWTRRYQSCAGCVW
jgi:hypothetical protein